MKKILKVFVIVLVVSVAGCAHHRSVGQKSMTKAEGVDETYPITGIQLGEFESLLKDVKEQIPADAAILSIAFVKHDSVVNVVTGTISGPLGGRGVTFVFEKKENRWKLVTKSVWIS